MCFIDCLVNAAYNLVLGFTVYGSFDLSTQISWLFVMVPCEAKADCNCEISRNYSLAVDHALF